MSKLEENEPLDAHLVAMPRTENRCYRCTALYEYHVVFTKKKELKVCERCCKIVKCWIDRGYKYDKILTL